MVSLASKVILGVISCLSPSTNMLPSRIAMHQRQLDFLEEVTQKMTSTRDVNPIPFFRVEQGYTDEIGYQVVTSLPLTSIRIDEPVPPGTARNQLLSVLYNSDADWLICMDDDHSLFTHYNCYELFWDLSSKPFLEQAADRTLIIPVPSYWEGFKDEVFRWGKVETHWFLKKSRIWGYLPIIAIPNIVKYGYSPIWFHEGNLSDGVPEDLKFEIDWVAAGGKLLQCYMWAAKSCGNMTDSSIFMSAQDRIDRISYVHEKWAPSYLRSLYPRNPDLWKESEFKRRKNPQVCLSIPRTWRYELKETDFPSSFEEKKKHSRIAKRS